jgi:hypothetical protein
MVRRGEIAYWFIVRRKVLLLLRRLQRVVSDSWSLFRQMRMELDRA